MGRIDWSKSNADIDRAVRAFQPWPKAYTFLHTGKQPVRLVLLEVEPAAPPKKPAPPGMVVYADGREGMIVKTGDGALWLRRIQPEGKRAMEGAEYVRGARIEAGMQMEEAHA